MAKRVRDYKKEYREYHGTPEQRANRSKRVLARRAYEKEHGDQTGKDIDHKNPLRNGGSNAMSNLRASTVKKNRGWNRGQ
jgi:5-methylcytosine-specific restriction endonuclease McrA